MLQLRYHQQSMTPLVSLLHILHIKREDFTHFYVQEYDSPSTRAINFMYTQSVRSLFFLVSIVPTIYNLHHFTSLVTIGSDLLWSDIV